MKRFVKLGIALSALLVAGQIDLQAGCFWRDCNDDDDDLERAYSCAHPSYVERAPVTQYIERAPAARYVERAPATRYVERAPEVRYVERAPATQYVERASEVRYVERAPEVRYVERASDCGTPERASDCGSPERSEERVLLSLLANPVVRDLIVGAIFRRPQFDPQPSPPVDKNCPDDSDASDSADEQSASMNGGFSLEEKAKERHEELKNENKRLHNQLLKEVRKQLTQKQLEETLKKNNADLGQEIVKALREANLVKPNDQRENE